MFHSLQSIALQLGYPTKTLTYLEKIRPKLYKEFFIPKQDDSFRKITTYCFKVTNKTDYLDDQQYIRLSELLYNVHKEINEHIFKKLELPNYVYGVVGNKTIKEAVSKHLGKSVIVRLDIKDFFGSTKSDLLLKSLVDNYGFSNDAAWLIARLVANKGVLPQGATTSPYASSLAFLFADKQIYSYCIEHGITYTRYYDDMIFSFNDYSLTSDLISFVRNIVNQYGYNINASKIKVMKGNKKRILGVYIINNKRISVGREYRRVLEASIYNFVVKHLIPDGIEPIKYKRSLMAKAAYCLYMDNSLKRLRRMYEQLKQFDPNEYMFGIYTVSFKEHFYT